MLQIQHLGQSLCFNPVVMPLFVAPNNPPNATSSLVAQLQEQENWLRNTTSLQVLKGVSETEGSNSAGGVGEERLEDEIEKWEEKEGRGVGQDERNSCIQMTGFHTPTTPLPCTPPHIPHLQ